MKISLLLAAISCAPALNFRGDRVYRVTVDTKAKKDMLASLLVDGSLKLDAWSEHTNGNQFDVRVPYQSVPGFIKSMGDLFKQTTVLIDNVQELVDREQAYSTQVKDETRAADEFAPSEFFKDYKDTDAYMAFLNALPGTKEFTIGTTYEKRPIKGVTFGTGAKTIVFNGGIHAREWISPAVTTYLASFLTGDDPRAVDMRQKFTFHVIPVLNPDGYAFTRSANGNRMWRKNREPNQGTNCIGTDINRNFGFKWSEPGASSSKCSDTYYGSSPMSTAEAKSLDSYIKGLKNVISYLDIHSYSQLWLYPWGWTSSPSPDNKDHKASAEAGAAALLKVNGVEFTAEQSDTLYQTSGTTDDHFYATQGVKYSMTVELRDTGNNGFVLPAKQIIPSGEEMIAGVIAFWNYAYEH